jgi:signal peptidase I
MSSRSLFLVLAIVILCELALIGCLIFRSSFSGYLSGPPITIGDAVGSSIISSSSSSSCAIRTEAKTVEGASMTPFVQSGEAVHVLVGYYACHPIERGDVVLYSYAGDKNPLIKIVQAVPGDRWSLENQGDYFLILVNGQILKNREEHEYEIPATNKTLPLYAQSYPVIPAGAYLILGDETGGTLDSSHFGLVGGTDILGKVIL